MTMIQLGDLIARIWFTEAMGALVYGFLNLPVLVFFFFHRRAQLRNPRAHLRPTAPTASMFHYFCAFAYGLALPSFYFLSVRRRHALGPWALGADTNEYWTIALGVCCMIWLAAHWLEAALRSDRIRFGRHWLNWLMGAAAVALCLRYHWKILLAEFGTHFDQTPWSFYPRATFLQLYFFGALLVYGGALIESLLKKRGMPQRRKWAVAAPLAVAAMIFLFTPFWLSIPRVTHNQAMAKLRQNQRLIKDAAAEADLDPALLAGVIYVAQTRDQPRWMGEPFERIAMGASQFQRTIGGQLHGVEIINVSMGLCQIQMSSAAMVHTQPISEAEWETMMFDPKSNITLAASILTLCQQQWRNAGYPMGDRPEILATLYNIGFERSHPKENPKANSFGRRVKLFMESEECRALFGAPSTN